ncbi:MAG: 50S ribosomal protein L4 [Leptolyngbyaceae bacterium]|nr:50S ribosomal protein L4 [Leptolyngbyaceae bacterium]
MAEFVVKDWQGEESGKTSLDLKVAKEENASHIVHRALVRQMANARQGTVSSKTRAEVRGGGRKPWRQKGTGRARAGSSRSPLWKGGGVIFGPKPRDYSVKMNKKERQLALRTAFQSRVEDMVVVEKFDEHLDRPKTKTIMEAIARWGVENDAKVLMVIDQPSDNLRLSVRNVPTIKLITPENLNIYDILAADQIVTTSSALDSVKEVYSA